MSSLIAPLGCWLTSPFAVPSCVTVACATEDGNWLVVGFESGIAWIFTLGSESHLSPKVMLAGHKSRITTMILGKIEVEGIAKHENMILSASDTGEAIMWDMVDGRCLQATPNAFDGAITAMKMTSSGKHVLCGGQAPYIAILDSSSLGVVSRASIGDWIETMFLYPTEAKYVDRIYYATIGGDLCTSVIDEQNLTLNEEQCQDIGRKTPSTSICMEVNRFDKLTLLLVDAQCCSIYALANGKPVIACQLPCSEGQPWLGGKSLSAKSLLLWTETSLSVFYLGPEKDIIKTEQMSTAPNDAIVLFARGNAGFYVKGMDAGRPQEPKSFTLVHTLDAKSEGRDPFSYMCHAFGKDPGIHHHFAFGSAGVVGIWTYFAGQNVAHKTQPPISGPKALDAEFTLDSIWPLKHIQTTSIVAVASVMNRLAALGYDNGDIVIVPISTLFQDAEKWQDDVVFTLKGHGAAITSLFVPSFRDSSGKNLLISGGEDCCINIWSMDDGTLLASLVNHAEQILAIFAAPLDAGPRFKNKILAVAADYSISVIDLEDYSCPCRFSGHASRIAELHWRTLDEILIVQCVDGDSYVWQLKTGHLDRVLEAGADADEILESSDCSVNCLDLASPMCDVNTKRSLSTCPIRTSEDAPPVLVAFLINSKRLISEIYGQHLATPPPTPPLSASSSSARILPTHSRRSTSLYADPGHDPRAAAGGRGGHTHQHFGHQVTQNIMEIFRSRPGSPAGGTSSAKVTSSAGAKDSPGDLVKELPPTEAPDAEVVQSIFEAVLSWGVDPAQDATLRERAELRPSGAHVAFGMRGANGQLSFMAPQPTPAANWTLSSSVSAARLLNIVALARAILTARGLEDQLGPLVTFYGAALPVIIGRNFAFASFSYLAKYWQDPVADVQVAARSLFNLTLQKMSTEDKTAGIEYWRSHLPSVTKHIHKLNMRAVLILGIIGSIQPELLNIRICKDVAESLDQLLREDTSRNLYRVPAVELIGSGFSLWEPHINGTAVLRMMIAFSGLATPPSNAASPSKDTAAPGASPLLPSVPPITTAGASPAVMVASRQAIVQIASANPALFISTLTMDLMHSKSASERAGSLKLLGMFIAKKPLVLLGHLGRVVEAIVKCLDPNLPHIRDALQSIVTVNFAELVKRFPNVAFHHSSQRLAVGTMEGLGVVYDVRIAARVQIMEGHTKSISAVSFSPDGKLIATFSLEENMVRIWQPAGGFLGTLVGALTTGNAASGAAGVAALASVGGVGHMKCFRTFAVGPPQENAMKDPAAVLDAVRFEWKGERQVMLHSINGLQLAFSV